MSSSWYDFSMKNTASLEHNIKIHNMIAKKYEAIHGEIYNEVEQLRLHQSLKDACGILTTGSSQILALDFGCGAGNLTQHLTGLGCSVLACDISQGFLDLVSSRTYKHSVTPVLLNGIDLKGIQDASVDMVVMYSVLHHVPDYLSLVKEFMRVLKKGGILYIDHEASLQVWVQNKEYFQFSQEIKKTSYFDIQKYFIFTNYIDRIIRVFINPKYQREGDIHVFKDDHIEWGSIRLKVKEFGGEIIKEVDYLLYKKSYSKPIFNSWKDKVSDTHLLIAKKQ